MLSEFTIPILIFIIFIVAKCFLIKKNYTYK